MTASPGAILSAAVTILVLLLYFYMGIRVGNMRGKHNVLAPATTGHPEFERAFRVHYNTLESLVIFLPLLWIATAFFRTIGWLPAAIGLVFFLSRIAYMQVYMADPAKRGTAVTIGGIASLGLLVLSIIGVVQAWTAVT